MVRCGPNQAEIYENPTFVNTFLALSKMVPAVCPRAPRRVGLLCLWCARQVVGHRGPAECVGGARRAGRLARACFICIICFFAERGL